MKMKAIKLAAIFPVLFLFSVEYSLARPGRDVPCKVKGKGHSSTQTAEATIEDKILKGPVIPPDDRKIGEVIFEVLSQSPDHVALIDVETGNQITFGNIKDRSIRLAVWMKKLGIKSNDTIIECSRVHVETYIPLFATFFVDAVFSAWYKNIPLSQAQKLCQLYAPKVIFADEEAADFVLEAAKLANSKAKIIVFGKHPTLQSLDEIVNSQTEEEVDKFTLVNERSTQEAAAIMMTSGTTGFPKGVLLSGKGITAIANGGRHIDSSKPLRVAWYTQIAGVSSLRLSLQTTVQKNVHVVDPNHGKHAILKTIEEHKVDIVRIPNPLVNAIAKSNLAQRYNLQSLKVVIISGTKINKHILGQLQKNLPNVFIQHSYGATETGGTATERTPKYKYIDSVGFPIANIQVKFVDLVSHEKVGPTEMGEICVKSPSNLMEYYKNPEMTKQVIDKEGWYHTGDVGNYAENGEVFVLDRVKHVIMYKNHSILPSEIEATLLSHPDVEEAAVVSIPHQPDGYWPGACVKKVSGSNVSEEDLKELMSKLEDYKQLRGGIYFLEEFPFDSCDKVSRIALENIAREKANDACTEE